MKKYIFWFLVGSFLSCSAFAERWLWLPDEKTIKIPEILTQKNVYFQQLQPLPWIIVDLPKNSFPYQRALRRQGQLYRDVKGYFASDTGLSNSSPNDPYFANQWHLQAMEVPAWWSVTQGENVVIAVLDSGVDPNHPDLKGNILFESGYDFGDKDALPYDTHGHGTAMAGLMVAHCNNALGGCGVAPQAKVIPYKLNTQNVWGMGQTEFSSIDLAAAILAASGSEAKIISMSLTLEKPALWVEQALRYAQSQQKIIVAAAGNAGKSQVSFPGNLPWVVSVGGYDQARQRQGNYGQGLMLSAPAIQLWTTQPGEGFSDIYAGTSGAAALVSGAFALLHAQFPDRPTEALITQMLNASEDTGDVGFDWQFGFGQIKLPTLKKFPTTLKSTFVYQSQDTLNVYHPYNTLQLVLTSQGLRDKQGDLFLRLNGPVDLQGKRGQFFKVWNSPDSSEKKAYNALLASPYQFTEDFTLPLFGAANAIWGDGIVSPQLIAGAYEMSSWLESSEGEITANRKILWLSKQCLQECK